MSKLDIKCVNNIRCLAPEVVQKANSGHPGMPMGMAAVAHVLWTRVLNFSSKNPKWFNRDRVILSNGHGSALQYVMLHLTGYNLTIKDLQEFRQFKSKTPGHPENFMTEGVEVTTGPLGQGFANGVGMAIAQEHLKANFNKEGFNLVDNTTYIFCGDGCLMEGISYEAASIAGHLKLKNIIVLYDDNKITIDGSTDISWSEDVTKRFESSGWIVDQVKDANNDLDGIEKAILKAKKNDKPTIIRLNTIIGFGSKKEGTSDAHGSPLGDDNIKLVKKKFGFDPEKKFFVDDEVADFYKKVSEKNLKKEKEWNELFEKYKLKYPELSKELLSLINNVLPTKEELLKLLPTFSPKDSPVATRNQSGLVLSKVAPVFKSLFGGSADLAGSNCTKVKGFSDFQKSNYSGRSINFGIREHAMAAIANGIKAYAGFIPYVATFLVFLGYMFGAARLSALSGFQVIYILTHDSIGLGEDGPTHQSVEVLSLVRSTPNFYLLRPADGNEVSGSYLFSLTKKDAPSVLALSRQNLPQLEGSDVQKTLKGAYILQESNSSKSPDVVLIGTGSEVSIAVEAKGLLEKEGKNVRVVSMPCTDLFDEQSLDYRKSVLAGKDGEDLPVLSIEAGVSNGWHKYSHCHVGMKSFGKSAPYQKLYEYFGLTGKNLAKKANDVLTVFGKKKSVPTLASLSEFE